MEDQVLPGDEHLSLIPQPDPSDNEDEEDYYPDDVSEIPQPDPLLQVMKRRVLPALPARTLLRFRSVSSDFNALISSPFMVSKHFLHPRSLSGMFYPTENGISYVSFDPPHSDLPDPTLSYLPEPVTIKASTHGLMCVRGQQTYTYYITNPTTMTWVELPQPATMKWVELPQPATEHHDDVGVVIVFDEPAVFNFTGKYRVVCVSPVRGLEGSYGFETFSSDEWAWAPLEYRDVGNIVTASGTAVGALAYWRMSLSGELFVLSYDPVTKTFNTTPKPHPEIWEDWWELGEMDRQLCVTSRSAGGEIIVNTMETRNEGRTLHWNEKGRFWVSDWVHDPPIRSQGTAISVMWEKKRLILRDMQGSEVSHYEVPNYKVPKGLTNSVAGFVPYISTLVTVRSSDAGTSTGHSINNDDVNFSSGVGTSAEPSIINNDAILQEDMGNIGSDDEMRN